MSTFLARRKTTRAMWLAVCLPLAIGSCWPADSPGQLFEGANLFGQPTGSPEMGGPEHQRFLQQGLIERGLPEATFVSAELPLTDSPQEDVRLRELPPDNLRPSIMRPPIPDPLILPDDENYAGESCFEEGPYGGIPASGFGESSFLRRRRPLARMHHFFGEYRELGGPLQGESWRYRPYSVGLFVGVVQGDTLIDDWVSQRQGLFGGCRFGWDHSLHWGTEMRFAFAEMPVYDSQRAVAAQVAAGSPAYENRNSDMFWWDVSMLYFPWGETRWRPYLRWGLGTAHVSFSDRLENKWDQIVIAMPLAMGFKYRYSERLALRFELADNMSFAGGGGFNTLHNFSVTGGFEVRFGGARKAYWPWNPSRHYW